jgi:hypothetical protein
MRPASNRPQGFALVALGVFLLAFVVRLAFLLRVQSPFDAVYSDMGGYVDRAEQILWNMPLPGDPRVLTMFPPGRHAILALEFRLLGRHSKEAFALWYAIVGSIPPPCFAALALHFVRRLWFAAIVGGLVALWYPQVAFTAFFSTELWFAAAIAIHAWLTTSEPRHVLGKLATGIAGATAFAVRPQFLLAFVLDTAMRGLRFFWRRGLLRGVMGLFWFLLPFAITVTITSVRFHRLAGYWGLISESSLNRVWADTDICQVNSSWVTPTGQTWSYWFSPPSKPPHTPACEVQFDGYIVDPAILNRIRRERMSHDTFRQWLGRKLGNMRLLVAGNLPWPESNYKQPPWRPKLQQIYGDVLLNAVLPLAVVGVILGRRGHAMFIAVANIVTVAIAAAMFYGEARYNVPYAPFALLLAAVGVYEISVRTGPMVHRMIDARRAVRDPSHVLASVEAET